MGVLRGETIIWGLLKNPLVAMKIIWALDLACALPEMVRIDGTAGS